MEEHPFLSFPAAFEPGRVELWPPCLHGDLENEANTQKRAEPIDRGMEA